MDAAGNLYGVTAGGTFGCGTIFELAWTGSAYASTPSTLTSFDCSNGKFPAVGLIIDAAGNLFGTTAQGGAFSYGTVFELPRQGNGYASSPTILASFDYSDGYYPTASLLADAVGNLYGTTIWGGTSGAGTVFEITDSGFAVATLEPSSLAVLGAGLLSLGLIRFRRSGKCR